MFVRRYLAAPILSLLLASGFGAAFGQSDRGQPTLVFQQFAVHAPIHIIAYGDSRFTDPSVTFGTNPRVREWLAQRVAGEHPQILLLTGDTPYTGAKAGDWAEFRREAGDSWRAGGVLVLPTIGNHETYGNVRQGIANYLSNFPQLRRHRYYSALAGSVEVISLDCTLNAESSQQQERWFAAQLDALPAQVDFLFILYHMPWMDDRQTEVLLGMPSKPVLKLRDMLEQRLKKMHARVIVVNGHIHNYERFERKGVEYIVSGGGGAEPYPILFRGREDLYRDMAFPVYHYLDIRVTNHQLEATMWKIADVGATTLTVEAKDRFRLIAHGAQGKDARPPASHN